MEMCHWQGMDFGLSALSRVYNYVTDINKV